MPSKEQLHNEVINDLLDRHRNGDKEAIGELFTFVYPDLRAIAQQRRNQVSGYTTLTPTSIINEAYLKIARGSDYQWQSKSHFYSVMSLAMRHFILTYIDKRKGKKQNHIAIAEELGITDALNDLSGERAQLLLSIGQLMDQRFITHPEEVDVIHCRIFLGLNVKEAAEKLEIGEATVKRRYKSACEWIKSQLNEDINPDPPEN